MSVLALNILGKKYTQHGPIRERYSGWSAGTKQGRTRDKYIYEASDSAAVGFTSETLKQMSRNLNPCALGKLFFNGGRQVTCWPLWRAREEGWWPSEGPSLGHHDASNVHTALPSTGGSVTRSRASHRGGLTKPTVVNNGLWWAAVSQLRINLHSVLSSMSAPLASISKPLTPASNIPESRGLTAMCY